MTGNALLAGSDLSISDICRQYAIPTTGIELAMALTELHTNNMGQIGQSMPSVTLFYDNWGSATTFGIGNMTTESEIREVGWKPLIHVIRRDWKMPLVGASLVSDALSIVGLEPVFYRRAVVTTPNEQVLGWCRQGTYTWHWSGDVPEAVTDISGVLF